MKRTYIILAAALILHAAQAATTNLNYTAGQINTALDYGLANSNTVGRVDSLEVFVAGSNGFANIAYTTAELDSALAIAEANSNSVARLDALEGIVIDADSMADLVFTNVVVDAAFSTALGVYANVDFSAVVGTNSAVLFAQISPTGSVTAPGWSYFKQADVADDVAGGIGVCYLVAGDASTIICAANTNGMIKASSETEVVIRLMGFFRKVQP